MGALDAGGVQEPGLAADQRAARKHQLGQREQTTRRDGACAIGNALGALERAAQRGVRLVTLELFERGQPGVGIVEPDHHAHGDLILVQMVEEGAAIGMGIQRPARSVEHHPRAGLRRINLPELLDANPVGLGIAPCVELEFCDQLATKLAARALGEHRVLGQQLHAWLVGVRGLTITADTHVTRGHAAHGTGLVIEDFHRGKARKYLHAQGFSLIAEPFGQVAQPDDVVAVIMKTGRKQPARRLLGPSLGQEQEFIFGHRNVDGRTLVLPIWQQLIEPNGVHDRARQNMGADFGGLFQDADRHLGSTLGGKLLQSDRGRQPRGASTDDDDVVLHRLTLRHELLPGSKYDH